MCYSGVNYKTAKQVSNYHMGRSNNKSMALAAREVNPSLKTIATMMVLKS